ncbi:competence type IV pilus assembly protein ComGB [Staphylococcus intermedius]|uniref:DNA transport machinery protein comGB n=1 Tax=Staphylococcus intermedius NCTC 11048 TaxID=1141106 RepID=A0A380G7F0_STAIN|nr:competence type IV pilus assembly protein ComGB [Staphylococcus intermedius]PCF64825.1 competence protein ComGB [Staphylococcus intermedius]PCF80435.1 competence protein ComGB [Staphylococcus intermedius]PCF81785.1 competence protein ComGB [Staphylococcus intermedius]PCF88122.1 competence protein ComGB [Staphylococcus intermedius]PCF88836.1 competence protein ComGB [Staphylococcus intermedius]
MKRFYESIRIKRTLRQLNAQHLLIMERLYQLLLHGFTFAEAMMFIYEQLNIQHATFENQLNEKLKRGANCYDIFRMFGYPETILMQLYFAERYGSLPETLKLCHQFYTKNRNLKKQLIKTIQYPIVLMLIFLALIVTLNQTVMQQFDQMYETMQLKQSSLQYFVKMFIQNFPALFLILLLIISTTYYIVKIRLKHLPIQRQVHFLTHLPIFKRYYKRFTTYHMTNQFVLFFRNGITLNDIVKIYLNQEANVFLQYVGQTLKTHLQQGESFSHILMQLDCFESQLISYIKQGEKRDKLDIEQEVYSIFLLDRIEAMIYHHIKWIQPIMFTFIGILVLSVYLIMMLPVFEMMQAIKE